MRLLSPLWGRNQPRGPKAVEVGETDRETGLPVRARVVAELETTLKAARRRQPVSLLIFDFSNIEAESPGGSPGEDSLLPSLARTVRSWIPAEHFVGRLRGREFAVLIGNGLPVKEVEYLADQVIIGLRETSLLGGRQKSIATLVGISHSTQADCSASELLRNADIALSRARASGRGRYVVVDRLPIA